jgi:hypothetical protein
VTTSVKTCAAGQRGCDHILVCEPSFGSVRSWWFMAIRDSVPAGALSAQSIIPSACGTAPDAHLMRVVGAIFCEATASDEVATTPSV